MESIRLLGKGSYVPSKILNNFDLERMGLDTSSLNALYMAGMTAKDPRRLK